MNELRRNDNCPNNSSGGLQGRHMEDPVYQWRAAQGRCMAALKAAATERKTVSKRENGGCPKG